MRILGEFAKVISAKKSAKADSRKFIPAKYVRELHLRKLILAKAKTFENLSVRENFFLLKYEQNASMFVKIR